MIGDAGLEELEKVLQGGIEVALGSGPVTADAQTDLDRFEQAPGAGFQLFRDQAHLGLGEASYGGLENEAVAAGGEYG